MASFASAVQTTVVTRERVVAPPDRFISVTDGELLTYFKSTVSVGDQAALTKLYEMLEGLCTNSFSRLRRSLEQDFAYFANAATSKPGTDPRERDPTTYTAELDLQEKRFLADFLQLLEAGHYKLLTAPEWDAAQAEEFLLTLPVAVNYAAMDDKVLPRALWASRPEVRADAPDELADRMLIFHRGVDEAHIQGLYLLRKVDLILTFFVMQPLFKLFVWIMKMCGVKKYLPDAPSYMAPAEDAVAAGTDESTVAAAELTSVAIAAGALHEASVNVERRTFDRAFPDGLSVFKQLFKKIELQEACFKDVIVLYRKFVPEKGIVPGEFDIIHSADPAFCSRNFIVKRFSSIPIADLELVFPDKKVYMPPQVMLQMLITLVGAIAAIVTAVSGGISAKAMWPLLTFLGSRAGQVYTTANIQRTAIQRSMQTLIYDRTIASQEAVLASLTDEMARQRYRELLVAYCILAAAEKPLTAGELDARCETFLSSQFGVSIDFTTEDALPTLLEWGLITTTATTALLSAAPLQEGLMKLDAVWDNLYSFTGGVASSSSTAASIGSAITKAPGNVLGKMFSTAAKSSAKIAAPTTTTTTTTSTPPAASGEVLEKVVSTVQTVANAATTTTTTTTPPAPVAVAKPAVTVAPLATTPSSDSAAKKKGLFSRLKH